MFQKSAVGVIACIAAASAFATPAGVAGSAARPGHAATAAAAATPSASAAHRSRPAPKIDTTGRKRVGKASVYANRLDGHRMADGSHMDPQGDGAASKTLPLGTTAKVTNLQTGQSAVVTIRDRGPYVPGRIVDLSPATAAQVGIDHDKGVSTVEVAPISVPRAGPSAPPQSAMTAPASRSNPRKTDR